MHIRSLLGLASRAAGWLFARPHTPRQTHRCDIQIPEGCDIHTPGCDFPECQIRQDDQQAGCK